jgi:hypothetical protein
MTKTQNQAKIFSIFIAVVALLAYSYSNGANWTSPEGNPPSKNTPAPIHVGQATQVKAGNLGVNVLAATTSVWSNRYCDGRGENCFTLPFNNNETPQITLIDHFRRIGTPVVRFKTGINLDKWPDYIACRDSGSSKKYELVSYVSSSVEYRALDGSSIWFSTDGSYQSGSGCGISTASRNSIGIAAFCQVGLCASLDRKIVSAGNFCRVEFNVNNERNRGPGLVTREIITTGVTNPSIWLVAYSENTSADGRHEPMTENFLSDTSRGGAGGRYRAGYAASNLYTGPVCTNESCTKVVRRLNLIQGNTITVRSQNGQTTISGKVTSCQ